MSDAFIELAAGMDRPCELRVPPEPPPWLDIRLFEIGRDFALNNLISIFMGSFRCLLIGLSVDNLR